MSLKISCEIRTSGVPSFISSRYFADWRTLSTRLKDAKVFKKAAKSEEEEIKIPEAIELQGFFEVLDASENWRQDGIFFRKSITEIIEGGKSNEKNQLRRSIIEKAQRPSEALLGLIFLDTEEHSKSFLNDAGKIMALTSYKGEEEKILIKEWMDNALSVTQILKYFQVRKSKAKGSPIDTLINGALETLLDAKDAEWFKWYDALRNYLTKKPQDDVKENKLKLNFENGSLLGGWSDGQEKSKASVLLKKDGVFYLGILKKKNLFDTDEDKNRKVYLDISPSCGRLILANLKFQTLAGRGFVGEFKKKYSELGKENPQEAILGLQKIIRDRYAKKYPLLKRIAATHYADKKVFDKDIQNTLKDCYVCEFTPVNWDEVESYVTKGEMYLFQISSKDSAKGSTGKKDLQTLYWNTVFQENSPFQLNGGGEIFYRKYAIKEKKVKSGYENKPWIIENKRFTENEQLTKRSDGSGNDGKTFFFHCPIKLNYKSKSYTKPVYAFSEISKAVNDEFSSDDKTCFLGIDRGEKHLAYFSLINQNGKLLDQKTLNMPFVDRDGRPRAVRAEKRTMEADGKAKIEIVECWDYNDLLEARAGDRDHARKNWQTIGTIKNLKEGYVSQAVRAVADLATQDNKPTYIVLEDLHTNFKRMRQKIEKSVYQKFEVALAKKLNFLVNKIAEMDQIGSVARAIQLTPPVNNYGDIEKKKQVGVMLYTRPNYTSQTDPVTGWRKCIYLKNGSEQSTKDQIIGAEKKNKSEKESPHFIEIGFDGKDYFFVYKDQSTGKEWKMYSGVNGKGLDRFHKERNTVGEWISEPQDVASLLDELFANFDKNQSLLEQIKSGVELMKPKNAQYTAWESLRYAIELIQQIRNTGTTKRDDDFLLSPVRDANGDHFDTRVYWDQEQADEKVDMPTCGDAVGAFNIARKGIIMNEHIKRGLSLYVADTEWDAWLAGEKAWKKWLQENMKSLIFKKTKS